MEIDTVTKLTLIARRSKEDKGIRFTSLMHLVNEYYLKYCYKEVKRGKAAGVDGRTVESYTEEEITHTIEETVKKMKEGKYQPKSVRRVYIKKGNGNMRPLGIPTVIDKIVQVGLAKILESIYEPIFLSTSYGYRPNRDAHECLKEVNHMIMGKKVNWIIDADIEGFFDHIDHKWMMRCLGEKIADPNFKRLIWKFLTAKVMEEGEYQKTKGDTRRYIPKEGTPQGGIISPILANIYLHYVLDLWFEKRIRRTCKGYMQLVRYADDFLIGVQYKEEAEKILRELNKRLEKFRLKLSEKKTRIMEFGRFTIENCRKRGETKPETFDFLGLTHYCTHTKDGRFMVRVKTSRKRMTRAMGSMNLWLKAVRNRVTLKQIWQTIALKLQGHYNYYGVSGNFEGINRFYQRTRRLTYRWMNRRSQKKTWNWERFERYISTYPLPLPKLTYAIYNTW